MYAGCGIYHSAPGDDVDCESFVLAMQSDLSHFIKSGRCIPMNGMN